MGRLLKKRSDAGYFSLMTFPGWRGSVIYLKNYLSTMFRIADVMVDKEEVAMILSIKLELPDTDQENSCGGEREGCVTESLSSGSKSHIDASFKKVAKRLESQGIFGLQCHKSAVKLYSLSADCQGEVEGQAGVRRMGLTILCGSATPVYRFALTLLPDNHDAANYLRFNGD